MDKETFLHQLEYAVTNNNKKLFVEIIFDLPAEVIINFTKEEFSRVISLSRLICLQQVDEFFYFLENEGLFFLNNALKGIDELNNSLISRFYYSSLISLAGSNKQRIKSALINNAVACGKLADMGIDSRENLEITVSLCGDARKIFPEASADYVRALTNEGNARLILADMGIDSRKNLEIVVSLYSEAKEISPETSTSYALALMNEGNARQILAEMGIDSRENFETAVRLYGNAEEIFPKKSESYALTLVNEGSARSKLADMGIDSRKNLEIAVSLYGEAEEIFPKKNVFYALALMNKGSARLKLADMDIDYKVNLETAVSLCGDARKIFSKTSAFYASALMNEGNARQKLADMGIDSRKNLETAVSLYGNARKIFHKTSANYARILMNEGNARVRLAEMKINSRKNFEKSKELYLESISILDKLEDGWTYSIALLNLNILLKNNFYKTGDKKHLEEWERNLGDIEEKIKDRDIRYKERIMARIHEIRAGLLEVDGNQGIPDASFEYYEAYKLSKEPYYKFMKEFCQARSGNKSFCKIVSDWKEEEKKGIFLDYYDYTVFECHLENALKKSIFRKEELELAREKLEEISSRTWIKIIKDRVSAYVFLINSLDFCFEQGSYEDAAENVRKACKIFHEFGDKPGCEMCECFHEALLENQEPESWRNVIQKILLSGEFSSNFYRLLCNYADKKRTSILQDLPLQILKNTNDIKDTLNDLQKMLNQIKLDCISIKDQVKKGFKGTDAELQQIIDKIDNSQQDLKYLIQVSNNMDSKEGECIREFSSQMLELMKKGDSEALKRFSEKIIQNSSSIIEIIEAANIPERQKVEAKSKLSSFKKISGIVKKKVKSFSVDVTKDVVVTLTSNEIIKLLTPVLSTAILGVPIPSKVVEILLEAIRNS